MLMQGLDAIWYGRRRPAALLRGASRIYGALASAARRRGQRQADACRLPAPVVVVGNISAGGTGKTPLLIALAQALRGRGLAVGVVSRGSGGRQRGPQLLGADADPLEVGDEPCLVAERSGCPVAVARERCAAAQLLGDCQLILSDDGLQHYAMPRAMEIAVVDAARGLGNRMLLPAGPLREPPQRLQSVDLVVYNGTQADSGAEALPAGAVQMHLRVSGLAPLGGGSARPLAEWQRDGALQGPVHALAGIGNPQRFFNALRGLGLELVEHVFPDHHRYRAADLHFARALPLVMTAKDAIKCRRLRPLPPNCWVLEVDAHMDDAPWNALLERLAALAR